MAKRRLKKKVKYALLGIVALIVLIVVLSIVIKTNKLHNSIEYKLEQKGYTVSEIEQIKSLNDGTKNYILENDYNKFYLEIVKGKYYIDSNFKEYINQHNKNKEYTIEQLIAYVNTGSYREIYEEVKEADITNPSLALVNKYNYLKEDYVPKDLKDVSIWYSYEGRKLSNTAYEPFINLFNACKDEGLNIVLYAGYRSYKDQNIIFNTYKDDYGERYADENSTRAGHSENQLGLSINIVSYYNASADFSTTNEYAWIKDNAHNYGFILRYPEGKEYITKYEYQPYLFRYVGQEAATVIYNENLTLEEYVAYYLK